MPRTDARKTHPRDAHASGGFVASAVKGVLVTAGVAALANMGRKMAVQALTAMARDWCEGLTREHEATLAAIDKLAEISADHPQQRAMKLTAIKHMITKHAMQEENVIYPMLRREESDEVVGGLNEDHGEVKAMLFELTEMDKADPAFLTALSQLRAALEEHMREEEDVLFPALRDRLTEAENRKLTRTMNMAGVLIA
jgi:iron-sulfur cluster repair protein YtfE (RIC family)